jgi:hypothetical protein
MSDIHMDDQKEVYLTRSKRGNQPENASDLPDFGIALKDSFAYSPHTPDLKAGPSIANFDLHAFTHHPNRQMPSQKAHNTSSPLKRKYQVTTMADSPLKLRISSTDGRAFGLDGTVDNPSPWDALAGEDADSDDAEPISDRHASSSGQQAGSSVQTAPTCPFVNPDHAAIMEQGGELYQVLLPLSSSDFTKQLFTGCNPSLPLPSQ